MLSIACIVALFPIKILSNGAIYKISLAITIVPTLLICTMYIELMTGIWILLALGTLFAIFIPSIIVDSYLESKRCNLCRESFCVSHKSELINKDISHKIKQRERESVKLKDRHDGPKRIVNASNSSDFEDWNERVTTTHRETKVIEVTKRNYRHAYYCNNCSHGWTVFRSDKSEQVVARSRRKVGKVVEKVED